MSEVTVHLLKLRVGTNLYLKTMRMMSFASSIFNYCYKASLLKAIAIRGRVWKICVARLPVLNTIPTRCFVYLQVLYPTGVEDETTEYHIHPWEL